MPTFNILKEVPFSKSFRVASIADRYQFSEEKLQERFSGDIPLEGRDWNVGVIYGASGTGKSTIAKELWGEHFFLPSYSDNPIFDEFPKERPVNEISSTLCSVGLGSMPSWLKPYGVLSTGEKMRVDLAMALSLDRDLIVFDEYTSVVDRIVAQVGSSAVARFVRKKGKKFIAVSCHSDILDWLEPDWIFCTDDMRFEWTRGRLRRPDIHVKLFKTPGFWPMFSKYHYLNTARLTGSMEFVGFIEETPACFVAVLNHPAMPNTRRASRLVVLPDYQGIGIGKRVFNLVADFFVDQGLRFVAISTHFVFNKMLSSQKCWRFRGQTRSRPRLKHNTKGVQCGRFGAGRVTASWEYKK